MLFTMKDEKIEGKLDKDNQITEFNGENFTDKEGIKTTEESDNTDLNQKKSKSQKAGLNAIRPEVYIERSFKDLAKDKGKSQTELFEAMFWNYINKEQEKEMEMALSFKSEINLISSDLDNILKHFIAITEKAQNTIIVERNNASQKIENLQTELETAELKNKELIGRNKELETSNEAFTSIKGELFQEIDKLKRGLESKDTQISTLQKDGEEKNILLSKYSARIAELEATLKEKELDLRGLKDSFHKQMSAIEGEVEKRNRLEFDIAALKQELKDMKGSHKEEKESLEKALVLKYEAEKSLAIVDIKLQLIDIKNELQEKLLIINHLKEKGECQSKD
jgi:chromosome segregation ATPase